jgi:tRNA/rRNA methyltransferase
MASVSTAEQQRLRVVLVDVRNPLNIGATARAMSNFGFTHLRVVNPYEVAYREARSAMGGASVLQEAEEFKTLAEAVSDCHLVVGTTGARKRELDQPLERLEQSAKKIRTQLAGGRVALIFGSEKFGLSKEDLTYCHSLLRIPTLEGHASMNLGQSVAVCLYELVRDAKVKAMKRVAPGPPVGAIDRLTDLLIQNLRTCGYIKPLTATSMEHKVRRMIRRLDLSAHDAELLTGMLRQMSWKLRPDDAE